MRGSTEQRERRGPRWQPLNHECPRSCWRPANAPGEPVDEPSRVASAARSGMQKPLAIGQDVLNLCYNITRADCSVIQSAGFWAQDNEGVGGAKQVLVGGMGRALRAAWKGVTKGRSKQAWKILSLPKV
jgi:hypothetical protein